MLTAVRVFEADEVVPRSSTDVDAERYYSVFPDGLTATLVDVTDHRARKTVQYDVMTHSNAELVEAILIPFTAAVTEPQQACQAAIVVDGSCRCRTNVLFGAEDGLLQSALVLLRQQPNVDSIFLSAVSFADGNKLQDMLTSPGDSAEAGDEPIVMEDTKDQFTSIESSHYEELTSETSVHRVLDFLKARVSRTRHQVYSIIVTFRDPDTMPNTTMQFISLAVNEVARDMKSTRYCLSAAAALLEANAPVQSFNGTKLSFLLKPVVLGHQPGAYIACFSPVSATKGETERETFKEAFCVAQTLTRLFDSRVGLSFTGGTGGPAARRVAVRDENSSTIEDQYSLPRHQALSSKSPMSDHAVLADKYALAGHGASPLPHEPALWQRTRSARGPLAKTDAADDVGIRSANIVSPQPATTENAKSPREVTKTVTKDVSHNDSKPFRRAASALGSWPDPQSALRQQESLLDKSDLRSLLDIVYYQQEELKQHAAHEERYRLRILELEESLRARDEQVELLTDALNEKHDAPRLLHTNRNTSAESFGRPRLERWLQNDSVHDSPRPNATRRAQHEHETQQAERNRVEQELVEASSKAIEEVRRTFGAQIADLQKELDFVRSQLLATDPPNHQSPRSSPPAPKDEQIRGSESRARRSAGNRLVSPGTDGPTRASDSSSALGRSSNRAHSAHRQTRAVPSFDAFMSDDPQYRMRHSSTPRQRRRQ